MRLRELASRIERARLIGEADPEILSIETDSRRVGPGALFVALPGSRADGVQFAPEAVARGARAVLTGREASGLAVPQVVADEPRRAVGEAAAALHDRPSERLKLIGVTGTNGKTTVAHLLAECLRASGERVGLLSTIRYETGKQSVPAPLTTPDAATFTRSLAEMVDSSMDWAVAEVSSHALDQFRVWPHRFVCGIFTNLTRDHLDYHADMGAYLRTKKRLFDGLPEDGWAVINQDDPAGTHMVEGTPARVCRYGFGDGTRVRGRVLETGLAGSLFEVGGGDRESWRLTVRTPLVGRHNVTNCLAVLAALHCLGGNLEAAVGRIESYTGVPGRLERIDGPDEVTAFVDYAHTPDALQSVLGVLRPLTRGRLFVVFGCGGDRDRGKRPIMGRAAEDGADVVILTDDNPRTEEAGAILDEIRTGLQKPATVRSIPDRGEAVRTALREAAAGDVVLVAGKGHEDYQIIGTERYPLDDRQLVREAMEQRHP